MLQQSCFLGETPRESRAVRGQLDVCAGMSTRVRQRAAELINCHHRSLHGLGHRVKELCVFAHTRVRTDGHVGREVFLTPQAEACVYGPFRYVAGKK